VAMEAAERGPISVDRLCALSRQTDLFRCDDGRHGRMETELNKKASKKIKRKLPDSHRKKVSKQKGARPSRQTNFRNLDWYEKAALSVRIRAPN
jgi:hypothetical protein